MQEEKKSFKTMADEAKISFKKEIGNKKRWLVCMIEIALIALLIVADLLTKKYIYGACEAISPQKMDFIPYVISFIAVQNTGASFGMLSGHTTYLTVVSTVCAVFLIFFIFYTYKRRNLWLRSALILITSGAIGNIIDRIALGYVRDFINFEFMTFAVFNFADSCLTVGTVVLLIYILFFYGKEEAELQKKATAFKQTTEVQETRQENQSIVLPDAVTDSEKDDPSTTESEEADKTNG